MEIAGEKLLHIFLVGQPQLLENVKTPSLGQLKQRLVLSQDDFFCS
jgi:type II secretory pathway predicted ATPase ExeA